MFIIRFRSDETGRTVALTDNQTLERHYRSIVLVFASLIFLTGSISPPHLMDDVDAVQTQIARNMLQSGDFITARLDGIAYMEKAPLKYWLIALSFKIFGAHDWAARLVIALAAIALCLLTSTFTAWAMGPLAGLYAGLVLSTCVGLFLFTRVLIPDSLLSLFIAASLFCFMRALSPEEKIWRWCSRGFWASMALALLTKGLIGILFPCAAALLYLAFSRQLFHRDTRLRLLPGQGIAIFLLIAAPWHVAATLANPPYLDLTLHAERGAYHGFFWFYFINEHVLRFLNLRYPRDYDTVPRPLFWLFHLIWFFPWSVYLFRIRNLTFRQPGRASQTRLLALCWIGFVLVFFTLSTTQEYYSLSCYPAIALLLGAAMADPRKDLTSGAHIAGCIGALAVTVITFVLWKVRAVPAPGDISNALFHHPDLYTLSMGHLLDLNLDAFAYLRAPLVLALFAVLIGAGAGFLLKGQRVIIGLALMMVLFFQAARLALVVFDPYLGTKPLADALLSAPPGNLIVDDQYYSFSSVFFYANRTALLLNGRVNNLEYGSYAPGAPRIFLTDPDLPGYWSRPERWYLVADGHEVPRLHKLIGHHLTVVAEAGNKFLFVNR